MDFGMSRFGSDPALEIISFISSLDRFGKKDLDVMFRRKVFDLYGYKLPTDEDELAFFREKYRKYPLYSDYFDMSKELGSRVCKKYSLENDESFDCT